jgi:hypothetical protein
LQLNRLLPRLSTAPPTHHPMIPRLCHSAATTRITDHMLESVTCHLILESAGPRALDFHYFLLNA